MNPEAVLPRVLAGVGTTTRVPMSIAVIMVCRNMLPQLERTIESIRALNDSRVLPIIIDGASTDGTAELLASLGDWAHHAHSEPDRGIYDAMNKGWAQAPSHAYVLYLGAGDLLYALPPDDELRDAGDSPRPLILGNTSVGIRPFQSRWHAELRLRNTAHHQAMLVSKMLSPGPPFDADLRFYADWDFNLRLYRQGVRAHHSATLRTYAEPGGASWSMNLKEIQCVARRNSGWLVGVASRILNGISRWRRGRRDASARSTY